MDRQSEGPVGSLSFLSLVDLSQTVGGTEEDDGCHEVQLMTVLPASQLLALYISRTKPHPPDRVGVKGQEQTCPCGCLLLLSYSEGKVILNSEPVQKMVTACPGERIVDMCCLEVGPADKQGRREALVVVTVQGEVKVLGVEDLKVSCVEYCISAGLLHV